MKTRILAILALCMALICMIFVLSACDTSSGDSGNNDGNTNTDPGTDTGAGSGPEQTVTENGLTYSLLSDNTYAVTGFDKSSASVTIPDTVSGVNVTTIEMNPFYDCDTLTSIKLGANVSSIADSAFYDCDALTAIEIGAKVTDIKASTFESCDALATVTLSEGLKTIGYDAFSYCVSLKSIAIPSTLTSIDNSAFFHCESLESVTFAEGIALETLSTNLFSYCYKLRSIDIPASVTTVSNVAFSSCYSLMSVTVGSGVTSLGLNTFDDCHRLIEIRNLSSLNIETGSTEHGGIAENARVVFTDATTPSRIATDEKGFITYTEHEGRGFLINYVGTDTEITVPDGITVLKDYAFMDCDTVTSISIGNDLTNVFSNVFFGCKSLSAINVSEENTYFTSIDGVLYNENATKLIQYPIGNTAKVFEIPNTVTDIGNNAFMDCEALCNVTIPDSVLTIGKYAFKNCASLTKVNTGNGVKVINESAFENCLSLYSVVIGPSVESIYSWAFMNCYRLVEVYNLSALELQLDKVDNGQITYHALCIETSIDTPSKVSTDANGFVIYNDGETQVLIDYCGTESEITIPAGISVINAYAVYMRKGVKSVTIGEDVVAIGANAFYGCTDLESATLAITTGWWRSTNPAATSGKEFSAEELATAATTAEGLRSKFFSYYWKRG